MSTVELDLPFDEYVFERMRYACEKAKKSAENALEKILSQKVVPTLQNGDEKAESTPARASRDVR